MLGVLTQRDVLVVSKSLKGNPVLCRADLFTLVWEDRTQNNEFRFRSELREKATLFSHDPGRRNLQKAGGPVAVPVPGKGSVPALLLAQKGSLGGAGGISSIPKATAA